MHQWIYKYVNVPVDVLTVVYMILHLYMVACVMLAVHRDIFRYDLAALTAEVD